MLLPAIIIITQDCSWTLTTCKCLWVSCGGVVNMLLVRSITSYFHYNIWGCMCSTCPFDYRWLKGFIYSSCYYHHQIGSIHLSHFYHIFRGCVSEMFVFIIIVQFMMSANNRICFVLNIVFVCLNITPCHYHHCANVSEDIELIKCLIYFVECVR